MAKKQIKKLTLATILLLFAHNVWAYDFVVDGIYYNYLYDGNNSVSVTFKSGYRTYSGNVTIPATVTYNGTTYNVTVIGTEAFRECPALDTVIISEGVTVIGTGAFNRSKMKSITIPNSVTTIENGAFGKCWELTEITIPNGVTRIGRGTFWACKDLTKIELPNSLTTIDTIAFSGCDSLTSITIPKSVTTIGSGAFEGCISLKSIEIPNGVTILERNLFYRCYSLMSITIPNSVTTIDTSAFSACESLTSITIPKSVTTIGSWAFSGDKNLDTIVCKATTPPLMGADVFNTPTTKTLFVPCGTGVTYGTTEGWQDFAEIVELPCINVTTNDATNITANAATLNGEVSTTGEVTAKGFQYKTTDEDYTTIDITTDEFVYNLTGLESDAEYTFRAFAVVEEDTTFGEEKTFTTLDDSGIEDIAKENTISIYPNPAKTMLTIENATEDVQIFDITGRVVMNIDNKETNMLQINISHLSKGMYFVKVGNYTTKFVKE